MGPSPALLSRPTLQCTLALHMPQAMKWQMVWALMTEAQPRWRGIWRGIRESYDYIMVSDDDLIMDACTIDIFFDVCEGVWFEEAEAAVRLLSSRLCWWCQCHHPVLLPALRAVHAAARAAGGPALQLSRR